MFAVIKSGIQQYKVAPGEVIKVEKIDGKPGDSIKIDNVLMVNNGKDIQIGTPELKDAYVTGEIVEQGRGKKIIILKHKRRKNHRKKRGHRQYFTRLKITEINNSIKS
jgi:large subunit ribosomal protein L21